MANGKGVERKLPPDLEQALQNPKSLPPEDQASLCWRLIAYRKTPIPSPGLSTSPFTQILSPDEPPQLDPDPTPKP